MLDVPAIIPSLAFSPNRHQHHIYATGRDIPEDPSYALESHTLYNAVPRAIAPRHQPQPAHTSAPLSLARAYPSHSAPSPSRSVSPMDVQYATYPSSYNPTFSYTQQHYKSASHLTPSPSPMDHKSFALAQIQPSQYSPSAFTFDPFAPDEDIEDTSSSSEEYGTMPPATPPSAPQHTLVGLPPTAIGYSNGYSTGEMGKSVLGEVKMAGKGQDPSVEAYGQYVARQQRIDFLRQREWMRRVTAWVDTVHIGSPQHQEQQLPHARQRAYNTPSPSHPSGTPVPIPQRNTPPRHRRQPQHGHPSPSSGNTNTNTTTTPRAHVHVPVSQHFGATQQQQFGTQQALPIYDYDNNTQIYYATPNHTTTIAAAPSPSPPQVAVEMTDDEPYLIYSTSSGPSEPSCPPPSRRQVERNFEELGGRSRSLSPNATVYTPRHQQQRQRQQSQRAPIPSSVPFSPSPSPSISLSTPSSTPTSLAAPSTSTTSTSFSSLKSSLSKALGPVSVPPGVPVPVPGTTTTGAGVSVSVGRRAHSRVPSLDSIKEEEEV